MVNIGFVCFLVGVTFYSHLHAKQFISLIETSSLKSRGCKVFTNQGFLLLDASLANCMTWNGRHINFQRTFYE